MNASNRLIVSILAIAALAIAFWMLALGPKREEADELSGQIGQLQAAVAEAQSKATEAAAAKHDFPADYRQLVGPYRRAAAVALRALERSEPGDLAEQHEVQGDDRGSDH